MNFYIKEYTDEDRNEILLVWEKSVLSTHDFLKHSDFEEIKLFLRDFNFNDLNILCLTNETEIVGFIALNERKIEMLFFKPEYIGKGLGKYLINHAIDQLGADSIDVNEQNINAFNFYKKSGFEVFERSDKDDQGKDYPILKMKLAKFL